jgi:glutamyl-tRNA synthetase
MDIRVRFAPSPTGYLHVGGLRTALYNYLFARHFGGKMILRIEDTDRTRFVDNATENLIKSLNWAGIFYDEGPDIGGEFGPYIQSERLDIYKKHALELVEKGFAYYAFDTFEDLGLMRSRQTDSFESKYRRQEMKNQFTIGASETKRLLQSGENYVIRLLVPMDEEIIFKDLIRDEVNVSSNDVDDQILLKSDGFPTYHLANVVDDHLMKITHVIRGEEWLPSTPKHVLLYKAFGWKIPEFAHLPLLLNRDKSKLSKRQGSVAVEDFIQKGYLKDAFINFIALLGWNPSGDREIYTIEEFIESFNIEKVNKGGAVFDIQKLEWMNQQYIKFLSAEESGKLLKEAIINTESAEFSVEYLGKVAFLFRERVIFIHDIPEMAPYMFAYPKEYEADYINKRWNDSSPELINPLLDKFRGTDDYSHNNLHDITKSYVESIGKKLGDVIHPIRLMITGKSTGAGMFETMEVLGKEQCIKRFELFYNKFVNI